METVRVEAGLTEAEDLRRALAAEGFDLTHVAADPHDRAYIYERGFSTGSPSPVMCLIQTTLATYVANHPELPEHARLALRRGLGRFREVRPHTPVSGPDDLLPDQPRG